MVITPPPISLGSAALVFDAPITLTSPYIDIARADRGAAALVGYEESNTSYYSMFSDNREGDYWTDGYQRESVTSRVGVTHQ